MEYLQRLERNYSLDLNTEGKTNPIQFRFY